VQLVNLQNGARKKLIDYQGETAYLLHFHSRIGNFGEMLGIRGDLRVWILTGVRAGGRRRVKGGRRVAMGEGWTATGGSMPG